MLLPKKIFEESVDVHGAHPPLQPHRVLLHLLRALPLVRVWRRNTQVQRQLRPCLDLLRIELAYQLKEGPAAEGIAVALGRCAEQLHQLGGVGVGGEVGVAVQDEGRVGIVYGLVRHVTVRRAAVFRHMLPGLARG